jgi:hypothetical protein
LKHISNRLRNNSKNGWERKRNSKYNRILLLRSITPNNKLVVEMVK